MNISSIISGFGVVVLLPVVLLIIAKSFGAKWGTAIRSALLVGVGFIGVWSMFGPFAGKIGPVASKLVNVIGVDLPYFDIGDSVICIMGFAVPTVGIWAIPVVFVLNYVLYRLKLVSTLNVDLWNYWQFALAGALVMAVTGSVASAWLAVLGTALIAIAMGDWVAPAVEETYGLAGMTISHLHSNSFVVPTIFFNWVLDKLGFGKIHADPESIKKRFGVVGDSLVLGLLIGLVLALVANVKQLGTLEAWQQITNSGIYMAAAMYLLPMMCGILIQGLIPIGQAIGKRVREGKQAGAIKIGLDSAVIVGNPAVVASTLIFLPIGILLMAFLPGNKMMITMGWAFIAFWFPMMVPITKGNIFKMVTIQAIWWTIMFYVGTAMSPILTEAYKLYAGMPMPEGAHVVTSLWSTMNAFINLVCFKPPLGPVLAIALFAAIEIALRKWPHKMYMAVGASREFVEEFIHRGQAE